jgi:hypothetical protein
MKLDSGRSTDFLSLPVEEAERTIEAMIKAEQTGDIEAMIKAEQTGDIEALKWCARRLAWLDDTSEIISGDDAYYPAYVFNRAWDEQIKNDPTPESIAAIINRADEPEPVTCAAAEKALDTVKEFFEENLAKKGLVAALTAVGILRSAIKDTGDGE